MTDFSITHFANIMHFHVRYLLSMMVFVFLVPHDLRAESSEAIAELMKHSTVRVVIFADNELKGHGTGFIISDEGHVVTNQHVIADAEGTVVLYCNGDKVFIRSAELIGVSSTADLAILKIDPIPGTKVAEIATSDLVAGQTVMTVGFPGILDTGTWTTLDGVELDGKSGEGKITTPEALADFVPAVFPGSVAKMLTREGTLWVMHSAKISPGNSGGPLIDTDGRVCGINTQFASSVAGVDYPMSIHASELVALAREHSIPIDVTSSKASVAGATSGMQVLLFVSVAAFAVVMFLMILRKPRMVMVGAVSKLVHSRRPAPHPAPHQAVRPAPSRSPVPTPPVSGQGTMRLRGRDPQGISYDLAFNESDFQRGGGRLVIGRNNDLSQLLLSHDSISRQHATLTLTAGTVQVADRNSGNGSKVNGCELVVGQTAVTLRSGDKLTLGEVDLMFEILN
jgi:hypothetical protein